MIGHSEQCHKHSYPSQSGALAHAKRRMKENRHLELRVYLCNKCGHWHMTSKEDRFRKVEYE